MSKEIMNLEELSKFLEIHPQTTRRLIREDGLPGRKVGRIWRFSKQAVLKWLDHHNGESSEG